MPSYRHIRAVEGRCITVLYCSVQYGVHLQLYRVEMLTVELTSQPPQIAVFCCRLMAALMTVLFLCSFWEYLSRV